MEETEQDGIRAETLRRLQVRQLFKGQPAQTQPSLPLPSSTFETTELTINVNLNMSK